MGLQVLMSSLFPLLKTELKKNFEEFKQVNSLGWIQFFDKVTYLTWSYRRKNMLLSDGIVVHFLLFHILNKRWCHFAVMFVEVVYYFFS